MKRSAIEKHAQKYSQSYDKSYSPWTTNFDEMAAKTVLKKLLRSWGEMTKIEADDLLEQIAEFEAKIKAAEDERDEFISHYEQKILSARKICEDSTVRARQEIATLTEVLRQFAAANLPENRKSIKLPSGTLKFCKKDPKYFIGGQEASGKSKALLEFAKVNAPEYLKTKVEEYVDWAEFKKKLTFDGNAVYNSETGETIEGLSVQTFPDTFTVETK